MPAQRRRQLQVRRLGAFLNESMTCELQCLNGGLCRWVSTDDTGIKGLILLGEPMQECLCQPGYGGTGCEIHVGMCPEQPNVEACACDLASQISSLASESYCSSSEQAADYCFPSIELDPLQQVLNANTSLQDVVFCVNGGRCTGNALGSAAKSSNVFAPDASPCLCPAEFAGPHCEFLTKYAGTLNSTSNDGHSGGVSNGSSITSIDDAFKESLIPNDDVPNSDAPGSPSTSQTVPQTSSNRATVWSVLACLCGVATVAVFFVVYRKRLRRQNGGDRSPTHSSCVKHTAFGQLRHQLATFHTLHRRQCQGKPIMNISNSTRAVLVESRSTTAHPSSPVDDNWSIHVRLFRRWRQGCRSGAQPPLTAHPASKHLPPENAQRTEVEDCQGDHTESVESTQGSSQHPEALVAGGVNDDDEVLVGTFENYSSYRRDVDASQDVGIPLRFSESGCDDVDGSMQPPTISRVAATSAFSRFPVVAMPPPSRMDESCVVLPINDQASLHSAYSSSYYSSESSTSLFAGPSTGYVVQTRESVLYSPNSLYTSTSDAPSLPSTTGHGLAAACSFSDYSSFPDSVTSDEEGRGGSTDSTDTHDIRSSSDDDDGSASGITMDWSEQLHFASHAP